MDRNAIDSGFEFETATEETPRAFQLLLQFLQVNFIAKPKCGLD